MRPSGIFFAAILVAAGVHATLLRVPLGPRLPPQEPGEDQLRMQVVFRPAPPKDPEPKDAATAPEPEPPVHPEPAPEVTLSEPDPVPPPAALKPPVPEEPADAPTVEEPDTPPPMEEPEEEHPLIEEPSYPAVEPAVVLPEGSDILGERSLHPYWDQVRHAIATHLVYPREARKRYIEGRVRIALSIDAKGQLVEVSPVDAHGQRVFIEAALKAVRQASPFPSPDSDLLADEKATAILPVRFEMTDHAP